MKRVDQIVVRLKKKYPHPQIALRFETPIELLVATILSAQCTDKRVNIVTEGLFKKYRTAKDYAVADPQEFAEEIRTTGFYRNKARNVVAAAKKIVAEHNGRVPETMKELLELPGVARKTANVVLYNAFGKSEGIAVDTHMIRVCNRLALTKHKEPVKIEQDLMKQLDRKEWGDFTLRIVLHGRQTCVARNPQCPSCVLAAVCPSKKIFYPGKFKS
ncbi:MAG: endonuclease III [Candidatus Omnitrophota bacterium]